MVSLISHTEVTDPNQAKTVANVLNGIVGGDDEEEADEQEEATTKAPVTEPTDPGDGPTTPTTTSTSTTPAPDEGKKELEKLLKVAAKLTETASLNEYIFPSEFDIRLGAASPVSAILSDKGKFSENWKSVNDDPTSKGAASQLQDLKNYLLYLAERREEVWDEAGLSGAFHKMLSGPNFGTEVFKTSPDLYKRKSEEGTNYFQFPKWEGADWRKVIENWGEKPEVYSPNENTKIPTDIFGAGCDQKQVSFVGSVLDTLPDAGRKNPA